MKRTERFGLVLSPTEKLYLKRLAEHERISRASVIRRLLWREAQRLSTRADAGQIAALTCEKIE